MPETVTAVAAPPAPARAGLRAAGIAGIGTALPELVVTSAEIAAGLENVDEEWILSRTGIRERRHARPGERLTDYAIAAGREALESAGLDAADLDLVLVGTMSQDELTPNTAPLVAHALGATRAGAFDVGAACTAWLSALAVAVAYVETRRADHVLVVGVDLITRFVDFTDRGTAPLFADGGGAAVVSPAATGAGIGPIVLGSDGNEAEALYAEWHDRTLIMDGPRVFKYAVGRMKEATFEALERAGLELDDIDLFVYHQANARILRAVGERIGVSPDRMISTIEWMGNNSAGTLPVALAAAEREGRLEPGARVLMATFGAGFTWGACTLEWGL